MSYKDITRKEFMDVYNRFLPNGWIRFAFKYFSKSTEKENMKLSNWFVGSLLGLFLVGFFATVAKLPRAIIGPVTYTYCIALAILVIFLLIAVWMNNLRLKKVMKVLGVTIWEYNQLADRFFE